MDGGSSLNGWRTSTTKRFDSPSSGRVEVPEEICGGACCRKDQKEEGGHPKRRCNELIHGPQEQALAGRWLPQGPGARGARLCKA